MPRGKEGRERAAGVVHRLSPRFEEARQGREGERRRAPSARSFQSESFPQRPSAHRRVAGALSAGLHRGERAGRGKRRGEGGGKQR